METVSERRGKTVQVGGEDLRETLSGSFQQCVVDCEDHEISRFNCTFLRKMNDLVARARNETPLYVRLLINETRFHF